MEVRAMRKIKEILFSENGMKVVNTLFFLAMFFYMSGLLFVAYIVWICYLVWFDTRMIDHPDFLLNFLPFMILLQTFS